MLLITLIDIKAPLASKVPRLSKSPASSVLHSGKPSTKVNLEYVLQLQYRCSTD